MKREPKIFISGDIHGAHKALLQVLERSEFNKEEDTLIFLGDVADGWSEVPECVDELLTIKNLVSIRGNHDIWLRDWLKSGYINPMWLPQGGQASYDAYLRTGDVVNQTHKDFFENQVDYYIDSENRLFVHAGWDYGYKPRFLDCGLYPVNGGNPKDNISKECHWSRELYYGVKNHHVDSLPKMLKEALEEYKEVFVGHSAVQHPFLPFHKANFWNLDTGAGWNGKLTLMDLESREVFQSDLVKELYPNEIGRR